MEKNSVSLKSVKILSVSSPRTVMATAQSLGLNPQEVFVRVTFEHEGQEYTGSNQLGILGETDYKTLLKARDEGTLLDLTVVRSINPKTGENSEFLYVETGVVVEDLFKEPKPVKTSSKSERKSLADFF